MFNDNLCQANELTHLLFMFCLYISGNKKISMFITSDQRQLPNKICVNSDGVISRCILC